MIKAANLGQCGVLIRGPHRTLVSAWVAKGRPRNAKFSEAARRLAEEIGQNGSTGAEQLAEYCFHRALKGSVRHAELFLHYTEGRPRQAVELSGPNASAVRFQNMTDEELEARLTELLGKYQDSNS